MLREFKLPDLGEGLTESEIVTWRVAAGDRVALNQIIADVETAKAVVELPSPVDGVVQTLHAEPGETVEVGSRHRHVRRGGDAPPASEAPPAANTVVEGIAPPARSPSRRRGRACRDPRRRARTEPRRLRRRTRPQGPPGAARPRRRASWRARRCAGRAAGTGHGDGTARRASALDAARALPRRAARGRPDASVTRHRPRRAHHARRRAGGVGGGRTSAGADADSPRPSAHPSRPRTALERRTPIKGVRKHTAAAMVRSAFTAPHATCFLTVDVTPTMELLERLAERRDLAGTRVSAARAHRARLRDRAARASGAQQPVGRRGAGDRALRLREPRHRRGDRSRARGAEHPRRARDVAARPRRCARPSSPRRRAPARRRPSG